MIMAERKTLYSAMLDMPAAHTATSLKRIYRLRYMLSMTCSVLALGSNRRSHLQQGFMCCIMA